MFHQNSVPQIPRIGDSSTLFPGAGGQFPGVPHPMGMDLPTVPGAPTAQLPSIGDVPPEMFRTGVKGLPSEKMPASGLPAIGNLTPHLPSEIPSSPGFPGMVSTGLSGMRDILAAPETPCFPSGSFLADISTPGLTPQDLSATTDAAQILPRIPTSLTPSNLAGTGQGVLSTTGPLSLGLSSDSGTTPGMTGRSFPCLPSDTPSALGLPQVPGSIPTGMAQTGLGAGLGLPSLPTQSNPDQLPIKTQDTSFGESGGSTPQIPGLGTRVPLAVPQVNSSMLSPVSSQVAGIPRDITSPAGMVQPSTAISFFPGSQVNSDMLPPVSSQVAGIPTDITSAAEMVPSATALGFSSGAMIPGSRVNSGMVPQDGSLPSSTAIPTGTQRLGDTMIPTNPYAGSVDEMAATKLQEMEMGLPPNMPNPDLLVRIDQCKSTLQSDNINVLTSYVRAERLIVKGRS